VDRAKDSFVASDLALPGVVNETEITHSVTTLELEKVSRFDVSMSKPSFVNDCQRFGNICAGGDDITQAGFWPKRRRQKVPMLWMIESR
jgi:hypothetical protein